MPDLLVRQLLEELILENTFCWLIFIRKNSDAAAKVLFSAGSEVSTEGLFCLNLYYCIKNERCSIKYCMFAK